MAKELQVKEFSALPVADDGKTLLYADGEVKQSSKNLSEMLTDKVNNKLDTTAFSTVSGNFLTAHQVIPSGKWENVSDVVIANSATWGTETDWADDISAASAYAYEQAVAQIPAPFDPTFLSGEIDKKLDKTFSSNFYPMNENPSGFLTEHQDLSNYATKTYVNEEVGKVGSYVTATLVSGEPNVQNPSNKKIYLTKIDGATVPDLYKEWIYTESSAWECIGDTTMDLSDYAKTDYVDELVAVHDEKIIGQVLTYNGTNNEWKSLISGQSQLPGYSPQNTNITVVRVVHGNPSDHDRDSEWSFINADLVSDDGQKTDNVNGYLLPQNGGGLYKRWTDQRGTHQGFVNNYYTTSETSGSQEIQDALALKEDKISFKGTNNTITSINNSAIGGGSVGGAGSDYVPLSAVECTIGSGNSVENCSFAQGKDNSAIQYSLAQGSTNFSYNQSVSFGSNNSAFTNSFALGYNNTSDTNSFVLGSYTSAAYNSVAFGSRLTANGYSFNFGDYNLAEKYSQTFGYGLKATNYATAYGNDGDVVILGSFVIGEFNKTSAAPFVIGNGTFEGNRSDLFVVDKDGNVTAQGHIYAEGGVLGASLDTLELAPDNETIEFVTSSHAVVNGEGEPEDYTVIKIASGLLDKINKLEKLVSSYSGNWTLPQ